jgi:hypothetical protein
LVEQGNISLGWLLVLLRVTLSGCKIKAPKIGNVFGQYEGKLWTLSTLPGCRSAGGVSYFNFQLVVTVFSELRFDKTARGIGRTVKNQVRFYINCCS